MCLKTYDLVVTFQTVVNSADGVCLTGSYSVTRSEGCLSGSVVMAPSGTRP